MYIIVGSTKSTGATGLYDLNESNSLVFVKSLEDSTNASWIIILAGTPHQKMMISTNETRGSIQVHEIVQLNTDVIIKHRSSIHSGGSGTTHLAYSSGLNKEIVIGSNYDSGSVSVFPVDSNVLSIEGLMQLIDQNRAEGDHQSHAHQCVINGNVAYVCDLGNDIVYTYSISNNIEPLSPLAELKLPVGCGPRHLAVNTAGTWAYILCELSSEIIAVPIHPTTSVLVNSGDLGCLNYDLRIFSMLPAETSAADMAGAAILLSDDGRFLYVSNRDVSPTIGSDLSVDRSSISVFSIGSEGDALRLVQTAGSCGRHPRHMALVSTAAGRVLLVANRDSQNFAVFPVNETSGFLQEDKVVVSLADPQCEDPGFIIQI